MNFKVASMSAALMLIFAGCAHKSGCLKCTKEKPKCVKEEPCVQIEPKKVERIVKVIAAEPVEKEVKKTHISVLGQGVAPLNSCSPAQAHAFAKRAAIADAYRLMAERIKGVHIQGHDTIKNMMVQNSTVRTQVEATVKNASVVGSNYTNGLCEVEMEVIVTHDAFIQVL